MFPFLPLFSPFPLSIPPPSPHSRGITNAAVYGAMDQTARKINVSRFGEKEIRVMIVTDLAARGLISPLLDNVINYDFPARFWVGLGGAGWGWVGLGGAGWVGVGWGWVGGGWVGLGGVGWGWCGGLGGWG